MNMLLRMYFDLVLGQNKELMLVLIYQSLFHILKQLNIQIYSSLIIFLLINISIYHLSINISFIWQNLGEF